MRALVGLVILVLAAIALLSAHERKPFVTPIIDAGVLPAKANQVEHTDNIACMRLIVPYGVTTDGKRKIVRT